MKKILFATTIVTGLLVSNSASAQNYRSALGIRLSSNAAIISNSVSFKYFFNEKTAVEALLSIADPVGIGALIEVHRPFSVEGLQWFYGGGGYLAFEKLYNNETLRKENQTYLGGMGVIGLDYKFTNIPLNLSLDWKPELNIVSDINFEPAAIGFSVRFTFGK